MLESKEQSGLNFKSFFDSEIKPPQAQTQAQTPPVTPLPAAEPAPQPTGDAPPAPAIPPEMAAYFSGEGLVTIFDIVMSRLMFIGAGYMGYKTQKSDFELSAKEKSSLVPIADRLAKKYIINISDELLLAIMLVSFYAAKFIPLEKMSPEDKAAVKTSTGKKGRPPGAKNKVQNENENGNSPQEV